MYFLEFFLKIFDRAELFTEEHFYFESTEEVFHYAVVQTISLSGHALCDIVLLEHLLWYCQP